MKRYLAGAALFVLLAMAAGDAVWPTPPPLLVD